MAQFYHSKNDLWTPYWLGAGKQLLILLSSIQGIPLPAFTVYVFSFHMNLHFPKLELSQDGVLVLRQLS